MSSAAPEIAAQALDALNRMQSLMRMDDGRHPRDVLRAYIQLTSRPTPALEPVGGDVLPPIGSDVLIRHGRDDDDHLCTVVGYYVWPDLAHDPHLHRVFVRVVYKRTDIPNARMLCDVKLAP